uniref:Haloacid dehalogenase-like hydrolase domain-containing protein Sgpp n=1 Tax=Tanacetum cinerariifolium TaxID=118510 RepID=A0A6L2L4B6_TANCI|nr:haloacid dehalogenase-like hydrolase domain-containing protein Sgpp [Tanacetum cinerariifolium]
MRRYALHYSTEASFQVCQNKEPDKPVGIVNLSDNEAIMESVGITVMVFTIDEKKVVIPSTTLLFEKCFLRKHDADIATILFPDDIPRGLKFCEDKEEYFRILVKEKVEPIKGLYKLTK